MPKPKEESTVRFIEYVKFYQLLWDKTDPDHKDFNKRSGAWDAIATLCEFESKHIFIILNLKLISFEI